MRSSSMRRHLKYSCVRRKKCLREKKAKKSEEENQINLPQREELLENEQAVVEDDPFLVLNELFPLSPNQILLEDQFDYNLDEFLILN